MTAAHSAAYRNYYQSSAQAAPHYAPLRESSSADVCVIGGGVAGCSTALHLAQRGFKVILLEAHSIGYGASGRSGGQLLPGYSSGQQPIKEQLGAAMAKQLWTLSVAAVQLTTDLIQTHHIDCDLQYGHLNTAIKPRQRRTLIAHQQQLEQDYGYASLRLLDEPQLREWLATTRYCAALYDSASAHLHPLNYTLGLARAAASLGVQIHEHSAVIKVGGAQTLRIETAHGVVIAAQAVLCGNAYAGALSAHLKQRIMPVGTYIIATESLGIARMQALMPHNVAVADTNHILDYFRRSADHRLLFGGRVSYSGLDFANTAQATRRRMLNVFPQLHDVNIEYSWGGLLDITLNRAPDFGRLQNNLYYLQGFSGHGMALAGLAGKLVAETLAGQAERFDLFTQLKHRNFPGGMLLRTPLLMLAMLWYRLLDLL